MENNTPATATETKIYNLVVELEEVKKNKKAEMQAYNNEIKRISLPHGRLPRFHTQTIAAFVAAFARSSGLNVECRNRLA